MKPIIIEYVAKAGEQGLVIDLLAKKSGLSKNKLKDAMQAGAVNIRKSRGKSKRVRKATSRYQAGDFIGLYYDESILSLPLVQPECVWRCAEYSVWNKPAGLLSQGNQFGDRSSLLRLVELADPLRKTVYLVHRLDREANGLVLIAHSLTAARHFSNLFHQQQVHKQYRVKVKGKTPDTGTITQKLDQKPAHTEYKRLDYNAQSDQSELMVVIKTGRTHQIRRHLASIEHPVMGDPKYGKHNKTEQGLQLTAIRLSFECPFQKRAMEFTLPDSQS